MVLESRHLVGLFLLVVVMCTIFFTLGYVMRGARMDTHVSAAAPVGTASKPADSSSAPAAQPNAPPAASNPSNWDFYRSPEAKKAPDSLEPAKPAPSPAAKSSAPHNDLAGSTGKPAPPTKKLPTAPSIPKGAFVLQVAALTRTGDALALAESLQKKGYSAYVLTPAGDKYYRVQVGPFNSVAKAEAAKEALERAGFKTILRK